MFGIDEGSDAAGFLAFGDGVDGEGGLTGALGAIDLDDASTGEAADTESHVEADGAGGDNVELLVGAVAEFHDGAFAVAFLNLVEGALEYFQLFELESLGVVCFFCHNIQLFNVLLFLVVSAYGVQIYKNI